MESQVSIPGRDKIDSSLLDSFQTRSTAHPEFYTTGTYDKEARA
jgi:hypothetical protein